jgi:hypothetical protein
MELVVAGVGPDNRSAVIQRSTLPDAKSASLWTTSESPPKVDRPATGLKMAGGCAPGNTSWGINYIPPNTVRDVHRTDLLSYNLVLSGAVDVVLETETVRLVEHDCLVCLGVLHGWETGSEGVTFTYTAIGLEPSPG